MLILHHNDLDGRCAAAVVLYLVPGNDARTHEINYGQEVPFNKIGDGEAVYIVDYSLESVDDWIKLLSITKNITWIDHHKTSLDWQLPMSNLHGIRSAKHSAARLAWEYLDPTTAPPWIVKLISDYDNWDHVHKDSILLKHGMALENQDPNAPEWKLWFKENGVSKIITHGQIIQQATQMQDKEYVQDFAFAARFEGYNVLCCNKGKTNSQLFESVNKDYDIFITFIFNGDKWTISLYSTTIDVSQIAQKYGGGGHEGAAGFLCHSLPFRKLHS